MKARLFRLARRRCAVVRESGAVWSWSVLLLLCCGLAGCQTLSKSEESRVRFSKKGQDPKNVLALQRTQDVAPLEGLEEMEKAKALFEAEEYSDAEKAFKKLARKYKDKPIEEEAMYYVGESQYQQERYPAAQDSFDELLKKYTSSRYLEQTTRRMFSIATKWLKSPKSASEIELAQYTEEGFDESGKHVAAVLPKSEFPLKPNFTDRTRPFFDTPGRALQALHSIWLHDPTGPLADDSLMIAATHHMRQKDYREADRYFSIIREEYPQSEHAASAHILGLHAKMMTYQGALYDGQQLQDARKLATSTLRLFPEVPQRKQLAKELRTIEHQAVARDWEMVEYWLRRKKPGSAAIYCEIIIHDHPSSPYAQMARDTMKTLGPQYAGLMSKPAPRPDAPAPEDSKPPAEEAPGRATTGGDTVASTGGKP